eukprot:15366011-Ditylum_brightwellii.AAC.1
MGASNHQSAQILVPKAGDDPLVVDHDWGAKYLNPSVFCKMNITGVPGDYLFSEGSERNIQDNSSINSNSKYNVEGQEDLHGDIISNEIGVSEIDADDWDDTGYARKSVQGHSLKNW